ncbi:hypothetical protein ACHAO8_011418 [Botrytis cinerea]
MEYYDKTPGGIRTEVQDDPEEEGLLDGLQETVRKTKEYIGEVLAAKLSNVRYSFFPFPIRRNKDGEGGAFSLDGDLGPRSASAPHDIVVLIAIDR